MSVWAYGFDSRQPHHMGSPGILVIARTPGFCLCTISSEFLMLSILLRDLYHYYIFKKSENIDKTRRIFLEILALHYDVR